MDGRVNGANVTELGDGLVNGVLIWMLVSGSAIGTSGGVRGSFRVVFELLGPLPFKIGTGVLMIEVDFFREEAFSRRLLWLGTRSGSFGSNGSMAGGSENSSFGALGGSLSIAF